jgi:hypothetical protein
MDEVIGGIAYWRMADLINGTMRTVMASRTLRDEISPDEAAVANSRIPGFNNNVSQVFQVRGRGNSPELEVADKTIKEVPTAMGHDWVADSSACTAPRLRQSGAAAAPGTTPSSGQKQRLFVVDGDVKAAVPISDAMIAALRSDPGFRSLFAGRTPERGDLVASLANLSEEPGEQTFIVLGRKGLPNLAPGSIAFWIVRQKGTTFETLNNFGGRELEIQSGRTGGYEDLELRTESAVKVMMYLSLKYDPITQKYVAAGGGMRK